MATIPEPDEKAAGGLQLVVAWLKQNLLATFGLVGAAVTLFGSLEPFLEFANFVQFIVEHWREWTRGFWQWLASLVSWRLPDVWADLLTFYVSIVPIMVKSLSIKMQEH